MTARFQAGDYINLIRNIRATGAIAPSSQALVKSMLKPINFGSARCIVELGPGNGCVTNALLRRMHPESRLICIELIDEFAARLGGIEDPRLHVYNACASSIRGILDGLNVDKVDYVISCLPLTLIDDETVNRILASVQGNLRAGGRFLQYQYSLANYGDMKPLFSDVKLRFTLRNIPPAFVYDCVK